MKLKIAIIAAGLLLNYSNYLMADIVLCDEEEGYVKRDSIISINGPDCSDNEDNGLCSIALSAPSSVEGRKFGLFTFYRESEGKIKTYLNIAPVYYDNRVTVRLDFEEISIDEITITAVYENLEGCTLRSHLDLGDLRQSVVAD